MQASRPQEFASTDISRKNFCWGSVINTVRILCWILSFLYLRTQPPEHLLVAQGSTSVNGQPWMRILDLFPWAKRMQTFFPQRKRGEVMKWTSMLDDRSHENTEQNKKSAYYETNRSNRNEVMMEGCCDGNWNWWPRKVVLKGGDPEGKWWWREWWKRKMGTMASGEEGKRSEERRRREVVPMGSGDDGKRWGREMINWGRKRNTKPCVFSRGVQWYLVCSQLRLGRFCPEWFRVKSAKSGCSFCEILGVSWNCRGGSHCKGCCQIRTRFGFATGCCGVIWNAV